MHVSISHFTHVDKRRAEDTQILRNATNTMSVFLNPANMSFFHVLPSNVASDSFPQNNASSFSTPISNPYTLTGKWEVALMNITYSGCVNTFHNDGLTVEKKFNLQEHLQKVGTPIRVRLTTSTSIVDITKDINEKLNNIVKVTLDKETKYAKWKIVNPNMCIIISPNIHERFELTNDVLTSWDQEPSNYYPFTNTAQVGTDNYITIVPLNYKKKTVYIKSANETMSMESFITRFNEQLENILRITLINDDRQFLLNKLNDDKFVTLCSPKLHKMLAFRQAGMFVKDDARYLAHDFSQHFKSEFYVDILYLDTIEEIGTRLHVPITLPTRTFKRTADAIPYLNEQVKGHAVSFSTNKYNYLQMNITDEETSITFSNTLRDIFAFDQNRYSGKGTFKASDTFSLTRRIHYLYIYSNISDYVRIGNTKAPLLAAFPINVDICRDLLIEKTFKTPLYVPVIKEHISQIDIFIYDGAGELVPFSSDAVTSLRLHFRQV